MDQPTSVATMLCSSAIARERAVWSCVLRIDDRIWYHDRCYYEIRGITPLTNDTLAAEIEAVIAGLSQAVNAHHLTYADIWVTHLPLFEVARRAADLPYVEDSTSTDDDESAVDQQKYNQVMRQVEIFLQGGWMQKYAHQQREYLQEFVEQLVAVRGHAIIEWHHLLQHAEANLPAPLADDYRRAQSLLHSLLLTDHPEQLNEMASGRIVEGQPTEIAPVQDIPDLTGLGAMILDDAPDTILLGSEHANKRTYREEATKRAHPSHTTHMPWIYAHASPNRDPLQEDDKRRGGHWRFYVSRDVVDEVWEKIESLVEQGHRVSTASAAHTFKYQEHQFNIFSSDVSQTAEVKRIREQLRALGITWPIAYKGHGGRPPHLSPLPDHDTFTLYFE